MKSVYWNEKCRDWLACMPKLVETSARHKILILISSLLWSFLMWILLRSYHLFLWCSSSILFFLFFSLLRFLVFCLIFVVPFYGGFRYPLCGCFYCPIHWCFDFPLIGIWVFLCKYFYFDALTDKKVIQVYFEMRCNAFFKL